jgi:hypothetical protein
MQTRSRDTFRLPGPLTLLFVLLGALMLLLVIGASEDAEAVTWENGYTVDATSGIEWARIDTDGVGACVAYTKDVGGHPYSYMRYYNGVTWSSSQPVTGSPVLSRNVDVLVEDAVAHFVYTDWTDGDGDIKYISLNLKTGVWGKAFALSSTNPGINADLSCIDIDDGTLHVVWVEDQDGDDDIYYRSGSGLTWSPTVKVSLDVRDEDQYWPDVKAVDGEVHVVWRDHRRSDYAIFYRHFNGTWGNVQDVSQDDNNQTTPKVIVSSMGVHVFFSTWEDPYWHTYMTTYSTSWSTPVYVGRSRMSTSEEWIDVDVEGDNLVLMYRTGDSTNNIVLRRLSNDQWALEQNVFTNPSGSFFGLDIDLAEGVLHLAYIQFEPSQEPLVYKYVSAVLNVADPWAEVDAIAPYWMDGGRMSLRWRAQDDYGLASVTVQYRYSADNATWDRWTVVHIKNVTGYSISGASSFTPSDGDGFYEFKAYATDITGKQEAPSTEPEAMGGLDTVDPTGSIVINGGDDYTGASNVTLTLSFEDATSGVAKVRFVEEAIGGDEPWEDPVDTKRWTLPEGEGMHTVAYQVMDAAGRTSEVYTAQIGLDTVAPTGSIMIEGGGTITSKRTVTITVTYADATSGVVHVRFAEEAIGGDEPWDDPVDTKEWDLGTESGLVTVCYQVQDVSGHVSQVYTATITLDVDKPTGTIALASGATMVTSTTVTLVLSYDDATSDVVGIRVSEEAIGGDEPWDNPVSTREFTLSAGDGEKDIHFQVIDEAGLVSDIYKLTVTLDTTNPFVESANPADAVEKVGVDSDVVVRFSEPMDRTTVEAAFSLEYSKDGASTKVVGTFTWSPDMRTLTFSPSADLEKGTEHTLSLTTGAKDRAGNAIFPAISYSFTTEKDASGDGGGGSLLLIMVVVIVLALVAVVGMMGYMRRKGGPGGGKVE